MKDKFEGGVNMRPLVEKTPFELNEEFEMAIKPFMHSLRKYCLSLTRTKWDGEDLMQEAIEKAYISWMKMPKQMAKSYLFRIASNAWIDKHRKRKIEENLHQDMSTYNYQEGTSAELFPKIYALLHELSAKQRVVILLVMGFGYSSKETASLLSVSEGSIKAALNRARKNAKQNRNGSFQYDVEDETTISYLQAWSSGDPYEVIRVYQNDGQQPYMQSGKRELVPPNHSIVQSYVQGNSSYVLISFLKKNGEVLIVPFYQLEVARLLSQITFWKEEGLLAIA